MLMRRRLIAGTTGAAAFLLASCGGQAGDVSTTADQETGQAAAIAVTEGKGGGAELFAAMLAAQEAAGSYPSRCTWTSRAPRWTPPARRSTAPTSTTWT
jgi:hypothetical protein